MIRARRHESGISPSTASEIWPGCIVFPPCLHARTLFSLCLPSRSHHPYLSSSILNSPSFPPGTSKSLEPSDASTFSPSAFLLLFVLLLVFFLVPLFFSFSILRFFMLGQRRGTEGALSRLHTSRVYIHYRRRTRLFFETAFFLLFLGRRELLENIEFERGAICL